MINPDLQPGKPVQTRNGLEAVIYAVHEGQEYPIIGAYKEDGVWYEASWKEDGEYFSTDDRTVDIIPKPKKLTGFINVYEGYAVGLFTTRAEADKDDRLASSTRIDCLDLGSLNLIEGHGLTEGSSDER